MSYKFSKTSFFRSATQKMSLNLLPQLSYCLNLWIQPMWTTFWDRRIGKIIEDIWSQFSQLYKLYEYFIYVEAYKIISTLVNDTYE